ncbi:hypothetical protein [Bacillus sp. cl95]|nr:hypothetical protein [Bacillus sp. cl95]
MLGIHVCAVFFVWLFVNVVANYGLVDFHSRMLAFRGRILKKT